MTTSIPTAPGRTLGDWLKDIYLRRRTGRLQITSEKSDGSLFFVVGDLYLSPEHPLYELAKAWMGDAEGGSDTSGVLAARHLAHRILESAGGRDSGEWSFVQGAGQIRVDLVGPLPTSQLVMESEVGGRDERALLRRLGGEEVVLRATNVGKPLRDGLVLDPQEAFLLSRLEHPVSVGELLHQVELGRAEVLVRLCRLLAVELIVIAAPGDRPEGETLQALLVRRFLKRIGESLDREPLTLATEQHRELLRNLFNRVGEMTHFEVLAVTPESTDAEIHKAYFELGRLVHPVHAGRLGLSGREGGLGILFERATVAYLTLSDPDRKAAYCNEIGPFTYGAGGVSEEKRSEERQFIAKKQYSRALGLSYRQEFHAAIQLLEQAVSADPRPEYLALLADCQAENPEWLDRAILNCHRAVQQRPDDPDLQVKLGRLHERNRDFERAKRSFRKALQVAPDLQDAQSGLARLESATTAGSKVSLADRWRSWWRERSQG